MHISSPIFLLASDNPFEGIIQHIQAKKTNFDVTDLFGLVLIVGGVALAAWGLSRVLAHQERKRRFHNPRALFRELCRAHQLNWTSARLLWQVAQHQKESHPARLFVEPERFDPANLSPQLRTQQAKLAALRDRLFSATEDSEHATAFVGENSATPAQPSVATVGENLAGQTKDAPLPAPVTEPSVAQTAGPTSPVS